MKKSKIDNDDYIKAIKKADREVELELNGGRWIQKTKPHKNKKKYNRRDNSEEYFSE